ncbi:MAG TPA: hypothetical protein VKY19_21550 [Ktedonosporobacter sp.]|jgi:small-conductance mechanosensitive channel|nr:hypothetical protein [Ktedonosporobacter sp.]
MRSTQEQRLLGRIIVLVFFLGLVFGLAVLVIGLGIYNFIRSDFNPLTPPIFGELQDTFQTILSGAFLVLLLTTVDVCSQFFTGPEWKNSRSVFVQYGMHFMRMLGFFLIGAGVIFLLEDLLKVVRLQLSSLQEFIVSVVLILLFLLGPGVLSWYLLIRDKRYAVQREQEEQSMRENSTERDSGL